MSKCQKKKKLIELHAYAELHIYSPQLHIEICFTILSHIHFKCSEDFSLKLLDAFHHSCLCLSLLAVSNHETLKKLAGSKNLYTAT